jgi:hypothetical protein
MGLQSNSEHDDILLPDEAEILVTTHGYLDQDED